MTSIHSYSSNNNENFLRHKGPFQQQTTFTSNNYKQWPQRIVSEEIKPKLVGEIYIDNDLKIVCPADEVSILPLIGD